MINKDYKLFTESEQKMSPENIFTLRFALISAILLAAVLAFAVLLFSSTLLAKFKKAKKNAPWLLEPDQQCLVLSISSSGTGTFRQTFVLSPSAIRRIWRY